MPTQKQLIIIFGILGVVAFGLGYWDGMPEKDSGERAEVVAPTVVTNVVTNTLKEVVTNIVATTPRPTPITTNSSSEMNPIIEAKFRKIIDKYRPQQSNYKISDPFTQQYLNGIYSLELVGCDLGDLNGIERLVNLNSLRLTNNHLTNINGLEKLIHLTKLSLSHNRITSIEELKNMPQLSELFIAGNPDLTKAQIDELQKALPNCTIHSNPKK